jgi:hypothetical protein
MCRQFRPFACRRSCFLTEQLHFSFTTKHMGNGKQAAWPRKGACTAGIRVVFSVISELSMNF